MMRHIAIALAFVVFAIGTLAALPASAQSTAVRQVNGVGTATITAQPELLRVTVQIKSEGPDVKAAMAKHAEDKQAARDKLQKMNIAGDAVTFAAAAVGDAPLSLQQQQMQMVMSMRGGKKATTTKSTVAVTSVLTAEVPLKAAGPDELLIVATELQEKIKAEFKPAKDAATPEEQEVLEEMVAGDVMPGQANPNEPQFLYVHKITDEEQKKALADAFAEARQRAARLAEAAEAQLGAVRDVSASIGAASESSEESMYAAMYANMTGQKAQQNVESEATSPRPGPVTSRVTVSGAFELK